MSLEKSGFFFVFVILLFNLDINAQFVETYKSSLPPEVFVSFSNEEKSVQDTNSIESGHLFLSLGRKVLVHHENLAIDYALKAKRIFKKLRQDSMVAITNLSLVFPYINQGLYPQADEVIQEVFLYAKNTKNIKMTADANLRLGYKEYSFGRPDKALAAYLECYRYYNQRKLNQEYGDIIMRLGSTYAFIGDCDTALKYWEDYLLAASAKVANDRFVLPVKSNMIECITKTGNIESAKKMAKEVIQERKKSNSYKHLSKAYLTLSFLSSSEKKWNDAMLYIDSAYHYAGLFDNARILSDVFLARARLFETLGKEEKALQDLKSALATSTQSKTPTNQIKAYRKLAAIYLKNKNYQQAFFYDQKGDSIHDALFSTEVSGSIKALEKQILQQNSDEKIALLENQNRLKNENIRQQEKTHKANITLLILSGVLLLLLTYLIIIRTRNNNLLKGKNTEIEKALALNKMLVKEMHHRVKNNLQIVASLLGLQSRFAKNQNVFEAVTEGKTRVQAMSLLHQSLYKNEDLKTIPIQKYFYDVCENLISTFGLREQNIELNTEIQDIDMDLDQVVTLGMIVNECIINSIKHAFRRKKAGKILLEITRIKNILNCRISDDGVGIPFVSIPEKSNSMGMQIISSFVKKLDGTITINNQSGTEIIISCKTGIVEN